MPALFIFSHLFLEYPIFWIIYNNLPLFPFLESLLIFAILFIDGYYQAIDACCYISIERKSAPEPTPFSASYINDPDKRYFSKAICQYVQQWSRIYYENCQEIAATIMFIYFFPYEHNNFSYGCKTGLYFKELSPLSLIQHGDDEYFQLFIDHACEVFPELKNYIFTQDTTFDDVITFLSKHKLSMKLLPIL